MAGAFFMNDRYILECIVHKRDERDDRSLPVRHMYGPYEGFEHAHERMRSFVPDYETILIHRLQTAALETRQDGKA